MATPLTEAFKALDILNEDTFDYSKHGIDSLEKFLDADNLEDTVSVIDTDAETEDELEDSYVGKVIFECPVCGTLNYHDKEAIEIDEEDNLANIDEECPYCRSVGGFKIIGEVAPYQETEVKTETEEEEKIEEACESKVHKRIVKESDKPAATSIEDAQKWVDYDMEKYGKISGRTNALVKKAGFQIVKDIHGDYEVVAGHYEALKESKHVSPRTRDDIDAIADNKKERARARFAKAKDDADADRDYQLKRNKLKESSEPFKAIDTETKKEYHIWPISRGEQLVTLEDTESGKKTKMYISDMYDSFDIYDEKDNVISKAEDRQVEESCKKKLKEAVKDEAYDVAEMMVSSFGEKKLITWDEFNDLFDSAKNNIGIKDSFEDPDFENDVRGILSMYGYATIFEGENEGGLELVESKSCAKRACKKKLKEAPIYGLETQFDARKSFGGKAQVEIVGDKQTLYSYNTPVVEIENGKVKLLPQWDSSATTLRHVKEFLKQNGFNADSKQQILSAYGDTLEEACGKSVRKVFKKEQNEGLFTDAISNSPFGKIMKTVGIMENDDTCASCEDDKKLNESDEEDTLSKILFDNIDEINNSSDSVAKLIKKLREILLNSEISNSTATGRFFKTIFQKTTPFDILKSIASRFKEKPIKESLENIELTTGTEKIKISTEKKEEEEKHEDETIVPVDVDTAEEILDDSDEETEDEVSFEENELAELGESYLKNVYNNVKSFETTNVSKDGKSIKVEGLINFNSGSKKQTSFTFSPKETSKTGKVRYIGENLGITSNKKAFTLTGKRDGNKLMLESLTYNYGVKNNNGKSTRVYGRVNKKSK